jgi:hypothetical protein
LVIESSIANLSSEIDATLPLFQEYEAVNDRTDCHDQDDIGKSSSTQRKRILPNTFTLLFITFLYTVESDSIHHKNYLNNNSEVAGDWRSYSADKLRTPKSAPLKRKVTKDGSLSKRLCNWAQSKSEMEDLRRTHIINEQELRLKHMQEIHALTIAQMKEKHELYVEECKLKMKILEAEHLNKIKTLTQNAGYSNPTNCS